MDRILRAIHDLKAALKEEYGVDDALTGLSFSHEGFDRLIMDSYQKARGISSFNPSDIKTFNLLGLDIVVKAAR